ncbi:MAG: radical SAM protein, partial [Nitrospinota bacterium]
MSSFELVHSEIETLTEKAKKSSLSEFLQALSSDRVNASQMAALLSPHGLSRLEQLAGQARSVTLRRFGKVIQLYTPIYLSNYCQNDCTYCGFRRRNSITRKIQTPEMVEKEALFLKTEGFKNLLLVAGEDPKVDVPYLTDTVQRLHRFTPSLAIEVAPKSLEEYKDIARSGAEGVVIYQETYNQGLYKTYHGAGRKGDFAFRLKTPERIARAGFHRLGAGVLLGLGDPVFDVLSLFTHIKYLLKNFWKLQITVSFPRIRKADGAIDAPWIVDDKQFVQIICAFRLAFPDVGIVLSTREEPY